MGRARWEAKSDRVRTERTLESYSQALEAMLATWKDHPIHATTSPLIDEYVAVLRSKGLSTSSIRHRLDCLAQCMRAAVEAGWLPAEPCKVRRPPLARRSTRDAAPEDEVGALIQAAEQIDRAHLALILLAADAGLRRAEIARLQPGDVDLERKVIRLEVRDEKDRPKSGRGRTVPIMTPRLIAALRGTLPLPWGSADGVDKATRRIAEAAKIGPHSVLHRLRHRWVTRLLEAGVQPHQTAQWAGHADLQTTLRYAHPEGRIPRGLGKALMRNDALMTQKAKLTGKVVSFNPVKAKKSKS